MTTTTTLLLDLWLQARSRFTDQLTDLTENDLKKRLLPSQNSVGFIIRHIADVELLFAKNVFLNNEVKVRAKTVISKEDTGEWTNLQELKDYTFYAYEALHSIIENQTKDDWEARITKKEFGSITKAEALGRIISHTAYHAGQMASILKHGSL